MLAFFYDFETTGFPLFDQPSDDQRQPHIVQAGGALVETLTGQIIASIDLIARPDGWTIPDEAAAVHGITTQRAEQVGVSEPLIVSMMLSLWTSADIRVGHNEPFDARIMRIGLKRFAGENTADLWKEGKAECTQKLATPIMKLPPTDKMLAAGRRHHKTANLSEAYEFFTGQPMENAHSAMADVRACMAVWFAINQGQAAAGSPAVKKFAEEQAPKVPAGTLTAPTDDGIAFL